MGDPIAPPPPSPYESPSDRRRAQREFERVTRREGKEGFRGVRPGYDGIPSLGRPLKVQGQDNLDRKSPNPKHQSEGTGQESSSDHFRPAAMATQGEKKTAGEDPYKGKGRGSNMAAAQERRGGTLTGGIGAENTRAVSHPVGLLMAPPVGGGNHGGLVERPARPKPSGAAAVATLLRQRAILTTDRATADEGNWDDGSAVEETGFRQGVEAQIGGIVDMEDDVYLKFEEEEEVKKDPEETTSWQLIARYMATFKPNSKAMFTRFAEEVWFLRTGIDYAEKGKNYYMITLYSKGDYDFVKRGGPWIYKQNALIVKDLDNAAQPSAIKLDAVPVWVKIYDVPFGKKDKTWGMRYGNALGEALEVDVPASELQKQEFLRGSPDGKLNEALTEEELKLAAQVEAMQMEPIQGGQQAAGRDSSQPIIQFPEEDGLSPADGIASQTQVVMTADMLDRMQRLQQNQGPASSNVHIRMGPRDSDMIPALRGLSSLQVSFGLVNDVLMIPADTVLGKRSAEEGEEGEVQGGRLELSLGLNYGDADDGGALKRGKMQGTGQEMAAKRNVEVVYKRNKKLMATGQDASRAKEEQRSSFKPSRTQYEVFWERSMELPERIAAAWRSTGQKEDLGSVRQGLDRVMAELQQWSKRKFGNVLRELDKSRKKLEELMLNGADQRDIRQETDHMNELLYREEMLWMQRSRINWLKEGDRNTRFFHQKAVWRARKNRIKKLKDDAGMSKDTPSDMERMATSYFKELFTRDPSLNAENLVNLFQEKVTADMNESLCKEFTDTEIGDALFQIGPLKAPGVDGFPARQWIINLACDRTRIAAPEERSCMEGGQWGKYPSMA
ncbi:hypothetical protein ACQ4PT_026820 [Festuca glaucescens]